MHNTPADAPSFLRAPIFRGVAFDVTLWVQFFRAERIENSVMARHNGEFSVRFVVRVGPVLRLMSYGLLTLGMLLNFRNKETKW